ncbi:MAG: SUMF1/EgtB/PvdO family nonheme iron enzyme [Bacteroidales bacterium]|nr:SUMF1/EgtB/PvdO family nonheme iron enzyme [Bacteroidales bacterium]
MKKLLYVLTGLCLLAGAFTGCEDPLKEPDGANGGGGTPGGTSTEQTGTLKGTVTDKETGLPLELALVELVPSEKKTVTDQNGEFAFAELLPGNYALKVSKLGYKTVESGAIAVQAVETVRQEIAMEKEQTDLRIVNEENEDIEELEVWGKNVSFKILNAGTNILEWEIPVTAAEWVKGFSKESGKLSPGASVEIEIQCEITNASGAEAVVYIMSNGGNKQLKLIYSFDEERVLGLKMVAVAGGAFQMGATSEQGSDAYSSENPVHSVTLDGFYIGATEVTQAQWEFVMGTTIAQQAGSSELYGVGDDYPMYYVSWEEAVQFCEKLSQLTGKTYRLPTEAEWEYAARGGRSGGAKYAGSEYIYSVAWYENNSGSKTHPVGQKYSNGLGLYDMSGNVWEWCSDWYGDYSYSPSVNPQGPASGSSRVERGGSWYNGAVSCRVSRRYGFNPGNRAFNLGFRVACSL